MNDVTKTATWGRYHISLLRSQEGRWRGTVRFTGNAAIESRSDFLATEGEAKTWAARALEARGCEAFVDGRSRSLVDFLVFQDVGLRST